MTYTLEIWLRGFAKDHLRDISTRDKEVYHPHITLVRPFDINLESNEEYIKNIICGFCEDVSPIHFSLEGKNKFAEGISYVPVTDNLRLLNFNNDLEQLLESEVDFFPKLNTEKILHVTTEFSRNLDSCIHIDQYMLRLTGIRNKKIWFSYDFVTQQVLSREDSLDKSKWYQTVHEFSKKSNLLPTREGYKKIN